MFNLNIRYFNAYTFDNTDIRSSVEPCGSVSSDSRRTAPTSYYDRASTPGDFSYGFDFHHVRAVSDRRTVFYASAPDSLRSTYSLDELPFFGLP